MFNRKLIYIFILCINFCFLNEFCLASTSTVTELTEEEIAYQKISKLEGNTIERLKKALLSSTTDFVLAGKKDLINTLATLELYKEGYVKHKKQGRRYAPVIYKSFIKKRVEELKIEYDVDTSTSIVIKSIEYEVVMTTHPITESTYPITGDMYILDSGTEVIIGEYDEPKKVWITSIFGIFAIIIGGIIYFLRKK